MKKRANGEGSYRKLPSGNWVGRIMIGYTPDGKRNIKSFTAPTKSEVQQKVREYLVNQKEEKPSKSITFSSWADTWYADHQTQVEASTYWNYSFTLKKIKDYFGNQSISEIKQLDINHFIDSLLDAGLSRSTISKCKSMLVQIFTSAEDNDLVQKNPALHTKSLKAVKNKKQIKNAFTPNQIDTLRTFLPDDLIGHSILLLIGTGMRVQELLALTSSDITEDGSLITVNKAVKMVNRQPVLGSTKSPRSNRIVPVARDYRKHACYLREHAGSNYIWDSNRENHLFTIEEFRNRYKREMKKIPSIPYYSPHCCRHTYITMLQAKQVPMDLICALAGHGDITTTLGYTHVTLETLKKVIDSLDKSE